MNTLWVVVIGLFIITTDYAVQKGGAPTFKELVTPSTEYKQDNIVYDQIQKVGDYYIPVKDTVYFINEKEIIREQRGKSHRRFSDRNRDHRYNSTYSNRQIKRTRQKQP